MSERHWSTAALLLRMDIALVLDGNRGTVSAERAQLRLDLANVVSDVDFGLVRSEDSVPRLERILEAARTAE